MKATTKTCSIAGVATLLAACWTLDVRQAWAQTFSEPATVFYGKVLGTGSAQDFLITEGALQWTIQRADGSELTLDTTLFSFHENTLSYRLEVPHAAFSLGLSLSPGGIPLPPTPQTHVHKLVTVDGETAELLGPAGSSFTTEQLLRTATYRMDLALGRAAADSDSDGMADWWEDAHGLDKQDPSDAGRDLSGDGLTALQDYLQGLDPNHDYRSPALLTDEVVVYPSGSTAILLDVKDLDSPAGQIVFTVTSLPGAGTLTLRNANADPQQPDAVLAVGSRFTQADLLGGRVVYDHAGAGGQPGSFSVDVADEDPAHATGGGSILLLAYEPAQYVPADIQGLEAQRLDNDLLARAGYVVMDGAGLSVRRSLSAPSAGLNAALLADYVASFGEDRPYALADGDGDDTLRGGHRDDVLFSAGGLDTLTGGPGADWFVFKSFAKGRKVIEDFQVAEGDVIDVSRLPAGPSVYANRYLRIVTTGGVSRLQVDLDGNGSGFTNLVIDVPGLAPADADLYGLVEAGRLVVGPLSLEPAVSAATLVSRASENGPSPAAFVLTRRGSLAGDLTVNIAMGGSAQNGTDYSMVQNTVVLPDGQSSVEVTIQPFADSVTEPAEVVELQVLPGSGYRVDTASRATLTIEDLLMLVSIEALEPLAVKESGAPAVFLVSRRDVIGQDVLIRLVVGGTAANGTDYNSLPAYVLIPAGNTTALLQVVPKATAQLAGGMETVEVSIKADAAYRVSGSSKALAAIVERIDTFDAWRSRQVPGSSGSLAEFAQTSPGDSGVPYLERYAFGLGASLDDVSGLPLPFLYEGRLGVTFRKPLGVRDIAYRVTAATDLTDRAGSQVAVAEIPAPDGQQDPQRVWFVVDPSAGDPGSIFTMVEIEWLR